MPKINIWEYDETGTDTGIAATNTVYIPGFSANSELTDDTRIKLCTSLNNFYNTFGTTVPLLTDNKGVLGNIITEATIEDKSYQLAVYCLSAGLRVLYEALPFSETPDVQDLLDAERSSEDEEFGIFTKLLDKFKYDVRFITSGGYGSFGYLLPYEDADDDGTQINLSLDYEIAQNMTIVASKLSTVSDAYKGRGDCLAIIDHSYIAETVNYTCGTTEDIQAMMQPLFQTGLRTALENAEKYAAAFTPWLKNTNSSTAEIVPPSFAYLTLYGQSIADNNKSWLAIAGLERGKIASTLYGYKPVIDIGEIAANSLLLETVDSTEMYDSYRPVNPICSVLPTTSNSSVTSYVIWGNRTYAKLAATTKASNYINIRQLCIDLKKILYTASINYNFEPNSDVLWFNFKNLIEETLEEMYNNQGIKGYKITKVTDSSYGYVTANIYIMPIEAVENFELTVYLTDNIEVEEGEEE